MKDLRVNLMKDGRTVYNITEDHNGNKVGRDYYLLGDGAMEEVGIGSAKILLNGEEYNKIVEALLPKQYSFRTIYVEDDDLTIFVIHPKYPKEYPDEEAHWYFPIVDYGCGNGDEAENEAIADNIYDRIMKERKDDTKYTKK